MNNQKSVIMQDLTQKKTLAKHSKLKLTKKLLKIPKQKLNMPNKNFTNNIIRSYKQRLSKCMTTAYGRLFKN